MWVLECDGDVLQNKRIWLRPGKKYLFGRTRLGTGFAIENKSISRKHLTISLAEVKPGDGSLVHTRSTLTIEDQNSKIGTLLDGEQIRGQSRILKDDEHQIKLGSYEFLFRIKWVPVVISFSFPSKEQKKKDPLLTVRSRLEALDVKTVLPYIIDKTTHVVANKRNTAKGLQALINARCIVTESFIDALVAAASPQDPDDSESQSLLEFDFDANWPDALQYLPDPGKEPFPRPSFYFAPDPHRTKIFEGYIFVFCDQAQFDNLQPPIVNGGGKALIYRLEVGKTTAADVVRFAKNAAGEKGLGEFEDKSEGEGVVLVRFRAKDPYETWAIELGNEIAQSLDQRVIEQSEFLDAILTNNPATLRKQLPEEDDGTLPPSAALPPSSLFPMWNHRQ
ncbi:DNA damage response protein RcaA [Xylona heveae TC161]|uniref:DNA damage response protein RcaA n=1 Tax=Xylona heveae (strain CBS 132557 / TC161) TaxID=1328760 RepID=A0A161TPN1_XYLHT|nr:DNA damage response protein RcaA [Xylona heveae TC161]KZF24196.1 DNA damage response protein RcaA [Xylona heveae TC161]